MLRLIVDRDGTVQMDQIGPLEVAGLTFAQAKKLIESKATQITGVQANVTMGPLRTIQAFVIGEVSQPGAYTVSALSRVSNALVAAGGISKIGSLRNVELRHGNQLVEVIDLYDILLHGNTSADRRLEQGDVIFVPVIGSVVGVTGDVKRPAIYELSKKHPENLTGVLDLCGGVTAFGYSERLQVERVENHKSVVALDISLKQRQSHRLQIRDGDVIRIFPVLPSPTNIVKLTGNVPRPGDYQWRRAMRVSELIGKAEGVMPHTFFKYALIKRVEGPQRLTHLVQVNLGAALARPGSEADIVLQPRDEFYIYSEEEIKDLPQVLVSGEVRHPGRFILSQDMKVSDLIYLAGGLKEDAYQDRAELVRARALPGGKTEHAHADINLRSILNGPRSADLTLRPNDEIFVRAVLNWTRQRQQVAVSGEVRTPGTYEFNPGMRLSDLISMAGGAKDDAYLEKVELARTEVVNGARTHHSYMEVDLRDAFAASDFNNPELTPNDEVFVHTAPEWHLPWVVNVTGQVLKPGPYVVRQGERLSFLLARCGGLLPDAYLPGTVFIRLSIKEMEQKRLDESALRLQQEIAQIRLMPTYSAASGLGDQSGGQSGGASQSLGYLQQVLAQAQRQQATGRLVIHVGELDKFAASREDVVLEDGDEIAVPRRPSAVNVLGQVYNPTAILYDPALTLRDYLERAGGPSEGADPEHVYVVKADGSIVTDAGYRNSGRSRLFPLLPVVSGSFWTTHMEPGDTVYVPEKLIYANNVEYAKDIMQIVASTAESLAIIGLLALK